MGYLYKLSLLLHKITHALTSIKFGYVSSLIGTITYFTAEYNRRTSSLTTILSPRAPSLMGPECFVPFSFMLLNLITSYFLLHSLLLCSLNPFTSKMGFQLHQFIDLSQLSFTNYWTGWSPFPNSSPNNLSNFTTHKLFSALNDQYLAPIAPIKI